MGTITPLFDPLRDLQQNSPLRGIDAAYQIECQNGNLPNNEIVKKAYTLLIHYISQAFDTNDVTCIRHAGNDSLIAPATLLYKHGQQHIDQYYCHGIKPPEDGLLKLITASLANQPMQANDKKQHDLIKDVLGHEIVSILKMKDQIDHTKDSKFSRFDPLIQALSLAHNIAKRQHF